MLKSIKFLFFIFLISLSFCTYFRHDINWYSYQTNHFNLYFNENTEFLAKETLVFIEELYEEISSQLEYRVRDKIDIIFADDSDLILDYANIFKNTIMINTAKTPSTLLGPFRKNSLYNLIAHELTHIVHLQISYLDSMYYSLLKRSNLKGYFYPQFIIEGLAIYNEKIIAGGGRLYNAYFSEQLHAFAQNNDFPTIGQITQRSMLRWPQGTAPYLIGANFINWLIENYGFNLLNKTFHLFAKDPNLSFEDSFLHVYGSSLDEFYNNFKNDTTNKYLIKSLQEQPSKIIYSKNTELKYLKKIENNSFYFYSNDFKQAPSIKKFNLITQREQQIYQDKLLSDLNFEIVEETLYYLKISLKNIYEQTYELTKVNLTNGKKETILTNIYDFCLHNNKIYAIQHKNNEEKIIEYSLEDSNTKTIYTDKIIEKIFSDINLDSLLISLFKNNKYQLIRLNLSTNKKEIIITSLVSDLFFHNKNLYFTSYTDNLSQLFTLTKNNSLIQKTNLLTGIYSPILVSQDLYYITYSSRGSVLAKTTNNYNQPIQVSDLNIFNTPTKNKMPGIKIPTENNTSTFSILYKEGLLKHNKKDIQPFNNTVLPYNIWDVRMLYLIPFAYIDNYGSSFGLSTMFADPLDFNNFSLSVYSSNTFKMYDIQYLNRIIYPYPFFQARKDYINDYTLMGFLLLDQKDLLKNQLFFGIRDVYEKELLIQPYYSIMSIISNYSGYTHSIAPENGFRNIFYYDLSRKDYKSNYLNDLNLYLPGIELNHVFRLNVAYGQNSHYNHYLSGFPMTQGYIRGYDIYDEKKVLFSAKCWQNINSL